MSIWVRITAAVSALARGEGLGAVLERLRAPPERSVAFTIAIIALGAKMAKADGRVTRDEVAAFRRVFVIPPAEEEHAARVFNLARQDVAGFEEWARRIARMFRRSAAMKAQILEGLLQVAVADGEYHPAEAAFLARVAEIFGVGEGVFAMLRARHLPGAAPDPHAVLGVAPGAPWAEVRAAWRRAVREAHPDRLAAQGLPPEAVKLAEARMARVNAAWADLLAARAAVGGEGSG